LLGLRVTDEGDIVLVDDAPQRADRDAIMSGAVFPSAVPPLPTSN
jgi:hypothetical protein